MEMVRTEREERKSTTVKTTGLEHSHNHVNIQRDFNTLLIVKFHPVVVTLMTL